MYTRAGPSGRVPGRGGATPAPSKACCLLACLPTRWWSSCSRLHLTLPLAALRALSLAIPDTLTSTYVYLYWYSTFSSSLLSQSTELPTYPLESRSMLEGYPKVFEEKP
jgi:hypothetical protein